MPSLFDIGYQTMGPFSPNFNQKYVGRTLASIRIISLHTKKEELVFGLITANGLLNLYWEFLIKQSWAYNSIVGFPEDSFF